MKDEYHPHYPSMDKDYFERLMRFAGYLVKAHAIGLNPFLMCNKEHNGW